MAKEKGKKREAARRERFTDRGLRALEPAPKGEFYTVYDEAKAGLAVRVTDQLPKSKETKAGSITFQFVGRFPGAKSSTRRTIGRFPAVSLADAKKQIEEWHTAIDEGVDPVKVEAERVAKEKAAKQKSEGRKVQRFIDDYIAWKREEGHAKADEDERDFYRECLPTLYGPNIGKKFTKDGEPIKEVWEGRLIDDIDADDIVNVLDRIRDRLKRRDDKKGVKQPKGHKYRQMQNMAQKLESFFKHWVDMNRLQVSPYRRKMLEKTVGDKKLRDRKLSADEVRALWAALETMSPTIRDIYRLLLLTGCRLTEITELEPREVHWRDDKIVVPASRTKSKRRLVLPLTDWTRSILDAHKTEKRTFFRSVTDGTFVLESKIRKSVEAAMLVEYRKLLGNPKASIERWTPHDLRRTMQSVMADEGIDELTIEAVVNHSPGVMAKTYQISDRLKEKKTALDVWERWLRKTLDLPPLGESPADNVVAFRA